jgi:transcriptional regulator with XRE-family HTH domain
MLWMKSDEDRGPIGAWARAARIAAGYRSAEHAARAAEAAGIHVTLPYLRGIESGWHRPGRALLGELAEFYGSAPPISLAGPAVAPEFLAEVRAAVAEGVAEGLARWEARRAASAAPPPRRPRPRQ